MTLSIGREVLQTVALATLPASPAWAQATRQPAYTAKAGMLKIGKDPERPDAEMFHVACTLNGADSSRRPVTFVFNGGPGASGVPPSRGHRPEDDPDGG